MTAATIPLFAYGSTTPRTISQRVEPSAIAPSSRSVGTLRKSSRQMADVIGTAMIVSTRIAGSIPDGLVGPLKIGRKPRPLSSAGSTLPCTHGART